ncbi:hypothetical protein AB1E22_02030 [Buttiauxella gaviniae]|uniref:Uncharacterized protein n=1 Tax=Buttiauxella gaviniae TaxID=82990 RepID=A0ABV3NPQ6_9ENTR
MNKKILSTLLFLALPAISFSDCRLANSDCEITTLGIIELTSKVNSGDGYSHITLNGKDIYKAKTSYMVLNTSNADYSLKEKKYLITKAIISYVSDAPCNPDKSTSYCSMNVILDLTSGKPVFSNEFFSESGGGSQITWVSWGKANSIIVIDNELRFKYSNGHIERVTKVKDATGNSSDVK